MEQMSIFDIISSPQNKPAAEHENSLAVKKNRQPKGVNRSGAVVSEAGGRQEYEKGNLYMIPVGNLIPDPEQPRKYFDHQALDELKLSITSHGILQPILVRPADEGRFHIVSGERRYQAARAAGIAVIPSIITNGEPAEIAIVENLLRENLTAVEEAEAIERLKVIHNYSLGDLAKTLGKADSTISEILSINRLPDAVKDDCRKDPKTARSILAIIARQKTPEKMNSLYRKYRDSGLTRGEIIKKTTVKQVRKKLGAADISAFCERLDNMVIADLQSDEKNQLTMEIEKLRSIAFQKLKLLKL